MGVVFFSFYNGRSAEPEIDAVVGKGLKEDEEALTEETDFPHWFQVRKHGTANMWFWENTFQTQHTHKYTERGNES